MIEVPGALLYPYVADGVCPWKAPRWPYGGSHLTTEGQRKYWRPKCINRENFDSDSGRGRDPDHQLPDVLEIAVRE